MNKRGTGQPSPSKELRNFTDREDELKVFRKHLHVREGSTLPILMFYGVGGVGKSWLTIHLEGDAANLATPYPIARIDFDLDPKVGGAVYAQDYTKVLVETRRQLGATCPGLDFPRFDLAYAMLRYKEGAGDEPILKGTGAANTAWELVVEGSSAAVSSIPGGNLGIWLARKVGERIGKGIEGTGLGRWLATTAGNQELLELRKKNPQEIYPILIPQLAADLEANLPHRDGDACRAVIFFDTFEALRSGVQGATQQFYQREQWICELYACLEHVLIVIAGRDLLTWGESDADWKNPEYLEQHRLGGLSEQDAKSYLTKCDVIDPVLQEAILKASIEVEERSTSSDVTGYHPFSLGLCVDIVYENRRQGKEPDPKTFALRPGDFYELAKLFLHSLASPEHERWVIDLAQTPRFDEAAARKAFSHEHGVAQTTAWETLQDYSFLVPFEDGWYTLHAQLREALCRRIEGDLKHRETVHTFWWEFWIAQSQNPTDEFASLSWYHRYQIQPEYALWVWGSLAKAAWERGHMTEHYRLLSWWLPLGLERKVVPTYFEAEVLNIIGVEFRKASQGVRSDNLLLSIDYHNAALRAFTETDFLFGWAKTQFNLGNVYLFLPTGGRIENLGKAIDYFKAALRVFTEADFPSNWAMTLNSLGQAYGNLPTSDKGENLSKAIRYLEASLSFRKEKIHPSDWAMTQSHLGNAYLILPSGDRGENLGKAVDYFKAALRVFTETVFPFDWAMIQNNLGVAYRNLPTGDRGENLSKAIDYFESALRIRTETESPSYWAEIQNNLGNVYSELQIGDIGVNLKRAINHYKAALRIRSESEYPSDWAMTQNNLAAAYIKLPIENPEENTRKAIDYFESALRVRTEAELPFYWAETQINLGNAYSNLSMGDDRGKNLEKAINCYEAALRIYTEEDSPRLWAIAQNNLALTHGDMGNGEAALLALECSQRGYRKVGLETEANNIAAFTRRIIDGLKRSDPPGESA